MNQTNHFFNLGYGWLCKHCSVADAESKHQHDKHSHLNDEHKDGRQGLALARWTDASRQSLSCPRCGIEEMVSKA